MVDFFYRLCWQSWKDDRLIWEALLRWWWDSHELKHEIHCLKLLRAVNDGKDSPFLPMPPITPTLYHSLHRAQSLLYPSRTVPFRAHVWQQCLSRAGSARWDRRTRAVRCGCRALGYICISMCIFVLHTHTLLSLCTCFYWNAYTLK